MIITAVIWPPAIGGVLSGRGSTQYRNHVPSGLGHRQSDMVLERAWPGQIRHDKRDGERLRMAPCREAQTSSTSLAVLFQHFGVCRLVEVSMQKTWAQ